MMTFLAPPFRWAGAFSLVVEKPVPMDELLQRSA